MRLIGSTSDVPHIAVANYRGIMRDDNMHREPHKRATLFSLHERLLPGLKVCRYAPVLRTGTSEKNLRQYRHFCQKNSLQQCRFS